MKLYNLYLDVDSLYKYDNFDEMVEWYWAEDPITKTISGREWFLYAYTSSKKIAKKFLDFRSKEVFKLIETDISKEKYSKLFSDFPEGRIIDIGYYDTKDKTLTTIYITMQENEDITASNDWIFDRVLDLKDEYDFCDFVYSCFKKKYRKIMKDAGVKYQIQLTKKVNENDDIPLFDINPIGYIGTIYSFTFDNRYGGE